MSADVSDLSLVRRVQGGSVLYPGGINRGSHALRRVLRSRSRRVAYLDAEIEHPAEVGGYEEQYQEKRKGHGKLEHALAARPKFKNARFRHTIFF